MYTLILKLDNLNTSYRLSIKTAKMAHFQKKRKAIAFGFVKF